MISRYMQEQLPKVLIVDDEKSLLNSLMAFFEDENFTVLGASSGEEALEILRDTEVEAVIVDMRLPGIDGNEVILKAKEMGSKAKFLIHTGSTDYKLPKTLLDLGYRQEHIFLKPLIDLSLLSDTVKKLIS